jgi:hypothetical protein
VSPQWSLFLRFPHQNPIHASLLPHSRYIPYPPNSFWFDHPHNIGWAVQIMKPLMIKFSPLPCYLVRLITKYSPQHTILKHPQTTFLPQCQRPSLTPIQNNRQIYSSVWVNKLIQKKIESPYWGLMKEPTISFVSVYSIWERQSENALDCRQVRATPGLSVGEFLLENKLTPFPHPPEELGIFSALWHMFPAELKKALKGTRLNERTVNK